MLFRSTTAIGGLKFVNPDASSLAYDFHTLAGSSAIDAGKDLTANGMTFDLSDKPRPKNAKYDIGAYEYQPGGPTANAGVDKALTLPTNSIILNGSGTSATGVTAYAWTQKSGTAATLTNANTANLNVAGLTTGIRSEERRVGKECA